MYDRAFQEHTLITPLGKATNWVTQHWIVVFALIMGFYVGLPFLAPVLMYLGWLEGGKAIYTIYSTQCHQLPQRSFFLFGDKTMYSLPEVQNVWNSTLNPLILRQFAGNHEMGWKVAWSDRMVSMYSSILVFGLLWWPFRQRIKPLAWWVFILLMIPMAIDGISHFISDFAGLGQGFRDSNAWLAALTNNAFPVTFYAGDTLGSVNSWLRLLTGVLFGFATVWFSFPYLNGWFEDFTRQIGSRYPEKT
jgi:uncharacterized membrane protein